MSRWQRGTPEGDAYYRRRWQNECRALVADLEHAQARLEMLGAEGERLVTGGPCGAEQLAYNAAGTIEGTLSLLREIAVRVIADGELSEEPTEPGRVKTPAAGGAIPNRREPR